MLIIVKSTKLNAANSQYALKQHIAVIYVTLLWKTTI